MNILGDHIVSRGGSINPSRFPDEIFELYSIPAHDRGSADIVRGSNIGSSKQLVQPGDVLISKIIPHIRRVRVVGPDQGYRQIASGEWIVFRTQAYDPGYLRHYLLSNRFHAQYMNTVAGVGGSLVRARPQFVRKLQAPLPELEEQRRIAAILDKADAIRTKRRQALHIQRSLVAAQFSLRFGDPMGSSQRFPKRRLGDISRIIRGASPRPAGDPRYFGGEIPWLKISDLTAEPSATVRDIRETVTEAGAAKSVLLPPNTLILSNSATVGIAKIIEPASCIHDGFLAFLDLDEKVDKRWLQAALELSRPRVASLAPEGTQKNLNGPIVKGIRLQIPPLDLQLEFLAESRKIDRLIASTAQALDHDDALFASLQSRAFKGEL